MEELRSTEIIDKEIIVDAEKKAERIAAKAEEECKKIAASVDKRVTDEASATENNLKLKLENFKRDLNASVALENARFFVSFIQDSVIKNINSFIKKTGDDEIINLLVKKAGFVNFSNMKMNAFVYGLDEKKCETALKEKFGNLLISTNKTEFNKILYEESFLDSENNKGIILITENQEIKCRFTMCSVFEDILDKYRSELTEKLFGDLSNKEGQEE